MKKLIFMLAIYLITMMVAAPNVQALDAMDLYNRGLASSLANRKIEYFSQALKMKPDLADAYEKRAIHYYYQERFDEAIADYSNFIELEPGHATAYKMRGLIYLKRGEAEAAIADLTQAIELNPELASAYGHRAEAYRLIGALEEAVSDATKAIQLAKDPTTKANAYATRAKIYQKLGREELSDLDIQKYVELHPRFFIIRYLSSTANLEGTSRMGLVALIGLAFVIIFKVGLPIPRKRRRK